MLNSPKHKGFTLIELISVIVMLGILAATAVPKFVNLSQAALEAKLRDMRGKIVSVAIQAHGLAYVEDKLEGVKTITVDNQNIEVTAGYPSAFWGGTWIRLLNLESSSTVNGTETCNVDWCGRGLQRSLDSSGITVTAPTFIFKLMPKGYAYTQACGVYYINRADGSFPTIEVENADC